MKPFLLLLMTALSFACAHAQTVPFMTGADVSYLPFYEKEGARYSDERGEADLITLAKRNGWNTIRLRLWVSPGPEAKYQVSDLAHVTALGKRIKAAELYFLLDLHYSDVWADPGSQTKPREWAELPFPELEARVRSYSRETVAHLRAHGAAPDMVQVGNEIKSGLLWGGDKDLKGLPGGNFWEKDGGGMERALRLFHAGAQGAKEGAPDEPPLIMLHLPDGQDEAFIRWFFTAVPARAWAAKIPFEFDAIGLSYYPADPWDRKAGYDAWHLEKLEKTLDFLATIRRPVIIAETHWPHRGEPLPIPGTPQFAWTPAGQAQFLERLGRLMRAMPDDLGRGVLLWETDTLNWDSVFDEQGRALPAVQTLGQLPRLP